MRNLKSFWLLLVLAVLGSSSAVAQLTQGKVYNFKNVGYQKSLAAWSFTQVGHANTDNANKAQHWYVETASGSTFTLRNLSTGLYLQGNNNTSGAWALSTNPQELTMTQSGSDYAIRQKGHTNNYAYLHINSSGNAVSWETSSVNTRWTFTEVSYTDAQIQAIIDELKDVNVSASQLSAYQTALNTIFADNACTTLSATYASKTAAQLAADETVKTLPAALQAMVLKVKNADWTEANAVSGKPAWDSEYAKRFRVQMIEPYSDPNAGASVMRMNAHTNLNNPTGIYTAKTQPLYIMVEGTIKDGSTLYFYTWTGHNKPENNVQAGYQLKPGLNVVPCVADMASCINYVVQTFDTSKAGKNARVRKLSDYDDLKIHIEGGYVTGFYNKMGDKLWGEGDNNADWDYYAARANQTDLTILGQYMTLQFPFGDEVTEGNKGMNYYLTGNDNVESIINEWDLIMLQERMVMGLVSKAEYEAANQKWNSPYSEGVDVISFTGDDNDAFAHDYSDYYNVHGLAYGVGGNTYMYGSWDHSGYHFNTMPSVIRDIYKDAGVHWGPGHEIGHQHQGPLTVNGLTEVTNNLFSNVVLWYYGESTSRYNGTQGALSNVLAQFNAKNGDFFSNNIWAQTIMYYKLFMYYHVLGHNTKFYPRLYEMLRQTPMSGGYYQDGNTCLMHFYKLCCAAAGEDLTEFFRAHGFFTVMKNRLVGDYSNSEYTLTQEQIDAAIAEVKAKKYKENIAVLFINDAAGQTIKSWKGDNLNLYGETTICAELGSYNTYVEAQPASGYTYAISGQTMTMANGKGGVGFAVLNDKNELLSFSDKKTFSLSLPCVTALAEGKAKVVVVNANSTLTEVADVMAAGSTDEKVASLKELVGVVKSVLDFSDATGKKVGYYKPAKLEKLQAAYNNAKTVLATANASAYKVVYSVLYQEYVTLLNDEDARISLVEGYAYRLTNKHYPAKSLAVDANNQMVASNTENNDNQLWYLEAASENTYYLKNKGTSKYPGDCESNAILSADKAKAEAYAYRLEDLGNGMFALMGSKGGLHSTSGHKITVWGTDADATRWYITANELDEAIESCAALEELIVKTQNLTQEMADAQLVTKLALQTQSSTQANYLSTNACHNTLNNASDGQGLAGLLDESTSTYFHSDYNNKVSAAHYLLVDLGKGSSVAKFTFNYTTRANGDNCPTEIKVEGSTNKFKYVVLKTFTAANDGLPNGNALSWESPVIENTDNYRYIRFTVTATENGKKFFVMSKFGVTNQSISVNQVYDGYTNENLTEADLKAQILNTLNAILEAQSVVEDDNSSALNYKEAYQALNEYYQALLAVYNNGKSASMDAKKAELQTLIDQTTELMAYSGAVTYIPARFDGVAPLQTTDADGNFYVSTNSDHNTGGAAADGGGIAALVDNNENTYFHTRWGGSTVNEPHYFQVCLGDGVDMNKFSFTYKPRSGSPAPTAMTVYGSQDGVTFTDVLATITSGLPAHDSGKTYQSAEIATTKNYKYLRFTVTKSQGPGNAQFGGQYFFGMVEFDLTLHGNPESCTTVLTGNVSGVTEDLLVATYKKNEETKAAKTYLTTEKQVAQAIAQLQEQYDALSAATYFTLNVNQYGYATLYLPYAVAIPADAKAYIVTEANNQGWAVLEEVAGQVLPANTGVVVEANQGECQFAYSTEAPAVVAGNMLEGSTATGKKAIEAGYKYYVLGATDGQVGLYLAQKYDANGNEVAATSTNATQFQVTANKAYLPVTGAAAAYYVFKLNGATGIDTAVSAPAAQGIYDLNGQRVSTIVRSGIYIVNGQKCFIQVK